MKNSYRYNLMGNRSEKNSERAVQYRYDALDRLIEVRSASCSEKYTYDHSNRRMTLEYFEEEKLKEEKRFLWDELVEIGAYTDKELVEFRVLGIGKGGDVSASIAIEIANKVYIPIHDFFGNITTLITQDGYIAQSVTYTAFGETDVTPLSPWGYQSKRYSKHTILYYYYYGQRFYDPVGRFAEKTTRFGSSRLIAATFKNTLHVLPPNCIDYKGDLVLDLVDSTDGSLENGILTAHMYREDLMKVINSLNEKTGNK